MWGVLVMASTVGLLLGLLVSTVVKELADRRAGPCSDASRSMVTLGGWFWPLPGKACP